MMGFSLDVTKRQSGVGVDRCVTSINTTEKRGRKMELNELLETLQQERDELKVRMHLAKMELQDEWEELEKKWPEFKSKAEALLGDTREVAEDVAESAKVVGEELKSAYQRIRERL